MIEKYLINGGVKAPAIKLSAIDVSLATIPTTRAVAFQGRLDFKKLKSSLKQTLKQFPLLSGRLRKRGNGDFFIDCNDRGMLLEYEDRLVSMKNYGHDAPLMPDIKKLSCSALRAPVNKDRPVAGIKVTHFIDGTVVVLTHVHMVMDGSSAWLFLNAWASVTRGELFSKNLSFDRSPLVLSEEVVEKPKNNHFLHIEKTSTLRTAIFIVKIVSAIFKSKQLVFHLSGRAISDKKQSIMKSLPSGEWVSSQDVAMAMIVEWMAEAAKNKALRATTVYNLRGVEGMNIDRGYIANAIETRAFDLPRHGEANVATKVARALRSLTATLNERRVKSDLAYLQHFIRDRRRGILIFDFMFEQMDNEVGS